MLHSGLGKSSTVGTYERLRLFGKLPARGDYREAQWLGFTWMFGLVSFGNSRKVMRRKVRSEGVLSVSSRASPSRYSVLWFLILLHTLHPSPGGQV